MKSTEPVCQYELKAARDAMEVIQGKWRIPIVISLTYGTKRFGEIHRDIPIFRPKCSRRN
jgi:DNA-binding HxlR family transcriptional regulator